MSSVASMNGRPRKKLVRSLLFACAALALFTSCSTTPPSDPPSPEDGGFIRDPVLGVAETGVRCTIPAMLDLWHRRASTPLEDFPMGPGDEVTISVPEIEELQNQHARISQDGTVSLPLIGTVKVGGMDEDRARVAISQRLARYMKVPRLEMYVERYRSRGVAVAGAVQKPGNYDLASFGDSLNDVIAMAGGLAPQAAEYALFLPVGIAQSDAAANQTKTSTVADERVPGAYSPTLLGRVSIMLPFGRSGDVGCLNMPARPGDVILVPAAGTVTVVGWVRNPGSFSISPGMTVLGAVTAAGGALFSWHVEVLRTDQTGSRVIKRLSLSDLENGEETDIPVKAGDVVLVEKSVVGAVPYGLYEIFQHFGTGIGIPIP